MSFTKLEVHNIFSLLSKEEHATATGNMYRKFGVVFEISEWTDTDMLIAILCSYTGGKVRVR